MPLCFTRCAVCIFFSWTHFQKRFSPYPSWFSYWSSDCCSAIEAQTPTIQRNKPTSLQRKSHIWSLHTRARYPTLFLPQTQAREPNPPGLFSIGDLHFSPVVNNNLWHLIKTCCLIRASTNKPKHWHNESFLKVPSCSPPAFHAAASWEMWR